MSPTIVVGYDGSAQARTAVDYAARRAGPDGRVFVVHDYAPPHDWLGRSSFNKVEEHHLERAREVMDGLLRDNDPLLDTNYETEVLAEQPADAILVVADTRRADEIVVGTRGHGAARAALAGSVSLELLQRASVPVVGIPAAPSRA